MNYQFDEVDKFQFFSLSFKKYIIPRRTIQLLGLPNLFGKIW